MSTINEAVVVRWWDELWSNGDLAVADELHTPDFTDHDPAAPGFGPGPDGMKEKVRAFRAAIPDLRFTIETTVSSEDHVVTYWRCRGTHEGELMGIDPTGTRIEVEGISIFRLESGRIAEQIVAWDALGLLQQVGAVPATA